MTVPIFVSPPVNAPSQGIEDARPAIAVKTSLKDVLAFIIVYRDLSNSL